MDRANLPIRLYLLVLLVAVAVVGIDSVTADTRRDVRVFARSRANDQENVPSKRLLRAGNKVGGISEEERMNNVNVAGFSQWLQSGKSVDDVFKILSLKGVETLLTNPRLNTFNTFVNRFNLQNPGNGATMIKTFTAAYGDDVMATMLETAKNVPSTRVVATKLQADQMKFWWSNKQSPDDVFKLSKLNHAANNPLSNPNLNVWINYLNAVNSRVRPGRESVMIKTFTTAYGDKRLAELLEAAKAVPGTEKIAMSLQVAQSNVWMMRRINPNKVYLKIFNLKPHATTIPEPYRTILNQYHNFYKAHL